MIGPWSYRSSYFSPPEYPDPPECECGAPMEVTDPGDFESSATWGCPECEARADRHRSRGDFLTRTRRARRGYADRAALVAARRERERQAIFEMVTDPDFLPV